MPRSHILIYMSQPITLNDIRAVSGYSSVHGPSNPEWNILFNALATGTTMQDNPNFVPPPPQPVIVPPCSKCLHFFSIFGVNCVTCHAKLRD